MDTYIATKNRKFCKKKSVLEGGLKFFPEFNLDFKLVSKPNLIWVTCLFETAHIFYI